LYLVFSIFAFSFAPYEARFKIQVNEREKFQASFFSRKSQREFLAKQRSNFDSANPARFSFVTFLS